MRMQRWLLAYLVLAGSPAAFAAAVSHTPAVQEASLSAEGGSSYSRNSTLQISPYLWAANLHGSISPFQRAPTISVGKSFSDVFRHLNLGGFIHFWGRRGHYVFLGDLMYVDTTDVRAIGPLPPPSAAIPPGTVVNGRVDSEQFMVAMLGGYRVVERPDFTLDVLGGARAWHLSNTVTVSALGMSTRYGEHFGWVDPVIGARAYLRLSPAASLQAQADAGVLGMGADHSWSALFTMNYIFTSRLSASAGYKALAVDYRHNGYVYDVRMAGPVIGFTYRF